MSDPGRDFEMALWGKLRVFDETIWQGKAKKPAVQTWLENFVGKALPSEDERLLALHVLSQFMWFGERHLRVLLKSLFRDLVVHPIVAGIRSKLQTSDVTQIENELKLQLGKLRFLPVGTASESGPHLLLYLRQEADIGKASFLDSVKDKQLEPLVSTGDVSRLIFVDDLCGSGQQVLSYVRKPIEQLRKLQGSLKVNYFVLFALEKGLETVRKSSVFNEAGSVFVLDDTFKALALNSRYYLKEDVFVSRDNAQKVFELYGKLLEPAKPLGFNNDQLLIGFQYNTPDNTLPIIWSDKKQWNPIFKRFRKK